MRYAPGEGERRTTAVAAEEKEETEREGGGTGDSLEEKEGGAVAAAAAAISTAATPSLSRQDADAEKGKESTETSEIRRRRTGSMNAESLETARGAPPDLGGRQSR